MAITLYGEKVPPALSRAGSSLESLGTLRERSEPGANAPSKAEAVGVGPRGTKQ